MTVDELIQTEIEKNKSIPHLLTPNHEWWGLTEAEEEIFRIDRDNWPRLLAIWASYEAVLNIAHHEWSEKDIGVFQQFLNNNDWLEECVIDELKFIRYGKLFGYDIHELRAVFKKTGISPQRISIRRKVCLMMIKRNMN